ALRMSLDAIAQRHDVLRSRFLPHEGRPVRLKPEQSSSSFTIIDLRGLSQRDPVEIVDDVIKPQLSLPFDLARGPLIRAMLVVLGTDDRILAIAVHHIVFDRWSKRLLKLELKQFYNAYATGTAVGLMPLPAHYNDYVFWQRQQLNSDRSQRLRDY